MFTRIKAGSRARCSSKNMIRQTAGAMVSAITNKRKKLRQAK